MNKFGTWGVSSGGYLSSSDGAVGVRQTNNDGKYTFPFCLFDFVGYMFYSLYEDGKTWLLTF